MRYSKSTNGFYIPGVHRIIPADAVDITDEEHAALIEGATAPGKRITEDANGFPTLADKPTPTHDELVASALATAREMRLPIISILDGMQSSALTDDDLPRAQAIEVAKLGLKNITKVDLSECTTADEMRLVILAAYLAIAKAAPDAVQTAFAQVLA